MPVASATPRLRRLHALPSHAPRRLGAGEPALCHPFGAGDPGAASRWKATYAPPPTPMKKKRRCCRRLPRSARRRHRRSCHHHLPVLTFLCFPPPSPLWPSRLQDPLLFLLSGPHPGHAGSHGSRSRADMILLQNRILVSFRSLAMATSRISETHHKAVLMPSFLASSVHQRVNL